MDTVFLYSGIGLIEDTSVSEGRGTTKPFQLTGNPNVNARDILNYFKNKVNVNLFRVNRRVTAKRSS